MPNPNTQRMNLEIGATDSTKAATDSAKRNFNSLTVEAARAAAKATAITSKAEVEAARAAAKITREAGAQAVTAARAATYGNADDRKRAIADAIATAKINNAAGQQSIANAKEAANISKAAAQSNLNTAKAAANVSRAATSAANAREAAIQRLERSAAVAGKSGVERLQAQREFAISRAGTDESDIHRIAQAYDTKIAAERKRNATAAAYGGRGKSPLIDAAIARNEEIEAFHASNRQREEAARAAAARAESVAQAQKARAAQKAADDVRNRAIAASSQPTPGAAAFDAGLKQVQRRDAGLRQLAERGAYAAAPTPLAKLALDEARDLRRFGSTTDGVNKVRTAYAELRQELMSGEKMFGRLSDSAFTAGMRMSVIAIPLTLGAKAAIDLATQMEYARIGFTSMLGSAGAADKHIEGLQAFARRTPFAFTDVVANSQYLQAQGFKGPEVLPLLEAFGNAVAASGGDSEKLNRVLLQVGQMRGKGKLLWVDVKPITEAGIPMVPILADKLRQKGDTDEQATARVFKAFEGGRFNADATLATLMDTFLNDPKYRGRLAEMSKTQGGMLSNLGDASKQFLTEVGNGMSDTVKMFASGGTYIVDKAKEMAIAFQGLPGPIKHLSTAFGGLVLSAVPVLLSIGAIASLHGPLMRGVTLLQSFVTWAASALGIARFLPMMFNPYTAAIAAAAAAFGLLFLWSKDGFQAQRDSIDKNIDKLKEYREELRNQGLSPKEWKEKDDAVEQQIRAKEARKDEVNRKELLEKGTLTKKEWVESGDVNIPGRMVETWSGPILLGEVEGEKMFAGTAKSRYDHYKAKGGPLLSVDDAAGKERATKLKSALESAQEYLEREEIQAASPLARPFMERDARLRKLVDEGTPITPELRRRTNLAASTDFQREFNKLHKEYFEGANSRAKAATLHEFELANARVEAQKDHARETEQIKFESINRQAGFEAESLTRSRDSQLRALELVQADTVAEKIALEEAKFAIDADFLNRQSLMHIAGIQRRQDRELKHLEFLKALNPADAEAIDARIDAVNRAAGEEALAESLKVEAEVQAARENAQIRQIQAHRDETRRTFDSLKSSASGLFDSLFSHTKSFGDALKNTIRTAILTPIKEILASQTAALFTQFITGQKVTFAGTNMGGRFGGLRETLGRWGLGTPKFSGGIGEVRLQNGNVPVVVMNAPPQTQAQQQATNAMSGVSRIAATGLAALGLGGMLGGTAAKAATAATTATITYAGGATESFGFGAGNPASIIGPGGTAGFNGSAGLPSVGGAAGNVGILGGLKGGAGNILTQLGGIGATNKLFAKGIYGAKGGALLLGGGILAADGLRRGGMNGMLETTAGGALIGAKFGGPWGAAIGATVGFSAGMIRMMFKSGVEKARAKIKEMTGIDVREKGIVQQVMKIAKESFGGDLAVAIRSPQVRELLELYAMSTGQSYGVQAKVRAASFTQSATGLSQNAIYENGRALSFAGIGARGPTLAIPGNPGGVGYSTNYGQAGPVTNVIQLDGPATTKLLQGEAVSAIASNPRAVQSASATAQRGNYDRREQSARLAGSGELLK